MQRFFDVVQDRNGTCIPNALVYVYVGSTSTLATLYSDNGVTPTVNPVTTNADGEYAFYAANGTYTLSIQATGFDSQVRPGTILFDPADGGVGVFVQAGTGAVTRTAQNKMRESYSVKDFGAVGDGVTDDSVAVQTAINNMTAGGTLVFPFGTYKISTSIQVPYSNITILGNGSTIDATTLAYNAAVRGSGAVFRFVTPYTLYSRTLSATANAGTNTLTLSSTANATAGQLIRCISTEVQYRNDTAIAYYNDQNKIVNVVGSTVTLESPLQYTLTASPYTVSVTYRRPISHICVDGFIMLGGGVRQNPLGNGLGPCGVWGEWVENIVVQNCKFYGFQGIAVGIDTTRDLVVSDCYFEGIDANTVIVEGQNSSFYAAYAFRARRVLFTRCIGQRVRHLYDGAEVYQFVQSDSTASCTHKGAFGSHEEVYDLNIVGNVSYACYSGAVLRALTVNVTGNTFTAGTSNNANWIGYTANLAITMSRMLYSDPGQARFVINSNRVYSYGTGTGAVAVVGSFDQLTIADNFFVGGNPSIQFNNADINLNNVVITGNNFLFDGSVANTSAISMVQAINGTLRNWVVSNNTARNHTHQLINMYGCNNVTNPADCIKITDNLSLVQAGSAQSAVTLRPTGYYGDNIVIRGNSQWGTTVSVPTVSVCSGQTYRLRGFPVVELNDETLKTNQGNRAVGYGASSAPTALNDATLFRGALIENTTASAGGPNYWVVTTAGTNGTIAGVTGSINSGTNTLTLTGNDETKVYAGSYITVAGAGLTGVRVDSIDATFTTATLSSNASSTVTGAAVSRANPIVSAGANLV